VVVGNLARGQIQRVDVGVGETPELGHRRVVYEQPEEGTLASTAPDGSGRGRFASGHTPAGTRRGNATALCFVRDTAAEGGQTDDLWCGELSEAGRLATANRVAVAPRGVLALQVAAGERIGAAYQTQEADDTAIWLTTAGCLSKLPATATWPR
jgi:hypothetical protein